MNKFTRIDRMATEPKARGNSRVYGQVSLGEPMQLQAEVRSHNDELRSQVENSLEQIAKEHLMAAEQQTRDIVDTAQAKANEILEKANAQARELIRMAEEQEQSIRDTAQESGFKSGFEEGYADATAQVEQETLQLLESARLVVEAAYQAEKHVLQDFETQALEMLRHLVKKVVRRELSDSPEILLNMVNHATDSLYLSGKVKVVLHPQVLHELRQFGGGAAAGLEKLQRFEWIADPALETTQIYIIGQESSFELSPDTQVDALTEPLREHLKLPRPEPEARIILSEPGLEAVEPAADEVSLESNVIGTENLVPDVEADTIQSESMESLELMDFSEPAPVESEASLETPEPAAVLYDFPEMAMTDVQNGPEDESEEFLS